ncbi:metallophosphoesterase [Haloarcula nitratireducens]|uniref:Phosphoesterase n=1 Tax=Haloarcula nitratireducens TaxID=2487749 RepID=A0AAW4PF39_9EURY|nr:metallophosphoesterase [Halomicroarcula nitratireducens]MBX0295925.1 metallophosphoesterase [Halomicroarcula nitratireducens]
MLTVISDTHGTDGHRLEGETLAAVREADRVVHAGDFTTEAVLDAVESEARELTAVYGNNDTRAVRERLADVATFSWADLTVLVVHGHEHTETALSMLARQENADVVVVGHSHRPELAELDGRLLVNPGSYADPRRYEPAHAELDVEDGRLSARLRSPDGTIVSSITRKR